MALIYSDGFIPGWSSNSYGCVDCNWTDTTRVRLAKNLSDLHNGSIKNACYPLHRSARVHWPLCMLPWPLGVLFSWTQSHPL
jgi:hypothetical protein